MNRILVRILSFSVVLILMVSLNSCSKDNGSANRAAGEKFLEENGKRAGVITTASGLQYEILVASSAGTPPNSSTKVKVHYRGTLIDGTEFDSSIGGAPAEFYVSNVIKGWTEVLKLMLVGAKWKVYIPYSLGYGAEGLGDKIPPYSMLIFEIELLGIVN